MKINYKTFAKQHDYLDRKVQDIIVLLEGEPKGFEDDFVFSRVINWRITDDAEKVIVNIERKDIQDYDVVEHDRIVFPVSYLEMTEDEFLKHYRATKK